MDLAVPYFERFIARFPDPPSLAAAAEHEVLTLWSGLGYYRRAKLLLAGAKWVVEHGGAIPSDPEALRRIPGVGRYTAGAIASIAWDRAEPIVDGNVRRVAARVEALGDPAGSANLDRSLWSWAEGLVGAAASPRAVNQAVMELGALVCRPRAPRCDECPLGSLCRARKEGRPERYPLRRAGRPPAEMSIPLYVVSDSRGRILLQSEHASRLTRGMFHLPHGSGELLGRDDSARFRPIERVGSFRHSITHRRIFFEVWRAEARGDSVAEGGEALWVDPAELDGFPHPSYVRKALAMAGPSVPAPRSS